MKSIRVSMTVYFLIVLVLALAAGLGAFYRITEKNQQENLAATSRLLEENYEGRERQVLDDFDKHIRHQAEVLARLARAQFNLNNPRRYLTLGVLTSSLSPQGHLLTPLWVAEGADRGPLRFVLGRAFTKIQIAEDVINREEDTREGDFFQVYNAQGVPTQRSRSMGGASFNLSPEERARAGFFEPILDDTSVNGKAVRRVTLKTPLAYFTVFDRGRGPDPRRGRNREFSGPRSSQQEGPIEPRPEPQPQSRPQPREVERESIFIQYASPTEPRDEKLAELRKERDNELNESKSKSDASLASLRNRLILIAIITLLAASLGSFWLVGLGLRPLRQLSDAVSQVSEHDISLRFKVAELPPELRPIAERTAQTLAMLARAFQREKQASADISHELRTPLAALLTTIEVGLRRQRTGEEYTDLLKDCHVIGKHMAQLVERLLVLARIDAGVDTMRPSEVDVAALTHQCVTMVRPLAEARNLTLELNCKEARAKLKTDGDKLREIMTNLLHNAIEYNRPNGRIDVLVERNNGTLQLSVSDTGVGIAPEARDRIFERFFRADPSRQADVPHAGVGLSIVKSYIDLMGATIEVESMEGRGSTFSVNLPVV